MNWQQGYTDAEIKEAEKLYNADCTAMYANGYAGDFGSGMQFAMTTYSPMCWRHYFKRDPPCPLYL